MGKKLTEFIQFTKYRSKYLFGDALHGEAVAQVSKIPVVIADNVEALSTDGEMRRLSLPFVISFSPRIAGCDVIQRLSIFGLQIGVPYSAVSSATSETSNQ